MTAPARRWTLSAGMSQRVYHSRLYFSCGILEVAPMYMARSMAPAPVSPLRSLLLSSFADETASIFTDYDAAFTTGVPAGMMIFITFNDARDVARVGRFYDIYSAAVMRHDI